MPTQQFDGPTLEEALAKVRGELGPDARIVGAEKVRTGGLAGFFAKERVEVTVEVDEAPAAQAPATAQAPAAATQPAAPAAAPMSILDLAESISDVEHEVATTIAPLTGMHTDDVTVATESDSFASVLRRIAGDAELAVAAQTTGDTHQPVAPAIDPTPMMTAVPAPAEATTNPTEGATNRALAAFTALARRTSPAVAEDSDSDSDSEIAIENDSDSHASELTVDITDEVDDSDGPDSPVSTGVVAVTAPFSTMTPAVHRRSMALQRLGLPGALMPMSDDEDLYEALVAALASLPRPLSLPSTRGTVMAVVGERNHALEVARHLAVETRTDRRDIVVCGSAPERGRTGGLLHLADLDEAEEQRRSWRRRLRPTIVVVDAPVNAGRAEWASDVLGALEPHSIWGVADAGRKLEDVAVWTDEVGGIDALAVCGVDTTATPASILQLGVPVAMIDGELASPELWAEILLDRLAA